MQRSSGSSHWKGLREASSECILSEWGGWHRERLGMQSEEWDPWSWKEKQQETRFENRKISLEGVGETRKVGEERRGRKAERQWERQKVTQKGGGEKERKRERENHIKGIKRSNWGEQGVQLHYQKGKCSSKEKRLKTRYWKSGKQPWGGNNRTEVPRVDQVIPLKGKTAWGEKRIWRGRKRRMAKNNLRNLLFLSFFLQNIPTSNMVGLGHFKN